MPRRGENIRKRKDGRWEARYPVGKNENGRRKYASVYADSYRAVKQKRDYLIQQGANTSVYLENDPPFSLVLSAWLENNQIRLKESTIYRYTYLIERHILPTLGNLRVCSIDNATINAFLAQKASGGRLDHHGGLSASYVRSIMVILHSALNFAAENNLCMPLSGHITTPPLRPRELSILSAAEQNRLSLFLLRDMDETRLGIYISLYTGLRIGEVCALSWKDIDLVGRLMYIRHTVARVKREENGKPITKYVIDTPKTNASQRKIPLNSDLTRILSEMSSKATSSYVISGENGFVHPRTYENRYRRILQDCGLPHIHYHGLRHTFATRCIEAGVDVKTLSEILGHSNVSITLNTYVHSSMELKRAQLEKLVPPPG